MALLCPVDCRPWNVCLFHSYTIKSILAPSHNRSPGKPVNPIEIKVEEEITAVSLWVSSFHYISMLKSTSTDSHSLLSVNTGENNVEKAAKQVC